MIVLKVRNVNEALHRGIAMMKYYGEEINSRNGPTLEINGPVCTTYEKPWERVLLHKERDANPFFHMFESLWILGGRRDVAFLSQFVPRMSDYSDNGIHFNAPYGWRMRNAFVCDQIKAVINILREDPNSRQAVIQIWSVGDLEKQTKDKACNMQVVFRIRNKKLHMTVYNRSNDMLWGAYGANVVQFSMLLEYMAAKLGVSMGHYHQVSNSFHVYIDGPGGDLWWKLNNLWCNTFVNPYKISVRTVTHMDHNQMDHFDFDLGSMFGTFDNGNFLNPTRVQSSSAYFRNLVCPMWRVWQAFKNHGKMEALQEAYTILADDWRLAVTNWLENRK